MLKMFYRLVDQQMRKNKIIFLMFPADRPMTILIV